MGQATVEVEDHPELDRPKRRMAVVVADVLSELSPTELLRVLVGLPEDVILCVGCRADAQLRDRPDAGLICSWCTSQKHEISECPLLRPMLRGSRRRFDRP